MNENLPQYLVENPRESLNIELKGWINPDLPEGEAKIVKGAIAMRNQNGGHILIGFHNDTGKPDLNQIPSNVRTLFHIDKIQGMVSKYSSESFEVKLHFPTCGGHEFPVIEIGQGVKTPVASKSELKSKEGKHLIRQNRVYVRSLDANNTPSTTEATWKDWKRVVEVCFDNREADIGRFMRRHFSGMSPELIQEFISALMEGVKPTETPKDIIRSYLKESTERFDSVVKERDVNLPEHGAWEVVLIILGKVPPHLANKDFLNLIYSINPNYTGWPVWLDSRGFIERDSRPYVINDTWESFIYSKGPTDQLDFLRLNPSGKFYLRRGLEDDICGGLRAPDPMTVLDFGLVILRTAEAIAVGLEFAKAMGCVPEETQLAFTFRWTKLKDRKLATWANPMRILRGRQIVRQDVVMADVTVPLETPSSALAQFVQLATKPLFRAFEGFELDAIVIEGLTQKLIERRL